MILLLAKSPESQALFLSDLKPQSRPASELFLFWHAGEAILAASQGGGKLHPLPPMTLNDTCPRYHGPLIEIALAAAGTKREDYVSTSCP